MSQAQVKYSSNVYKTKFSGNSWGRQLETQNQLWENIYIFFITNVYFQNS